MRIVMLEMIRWESPKNGWRRLWGFGKVIGIGESAGIQTRVLLE